MYSTVILNAELNFSLIKMKETGTKEEITQVSIDCLDDT
jgi:hypothetical protein